MKTKMITKKTIPLRLKNFFRPVFLMFFISGTAFAGDYKMRYDLPVKSDMILGGDVSSNPNEGWTKFANYFNGPYVSDQDWLSLVANMNEGIKVVIDNNKEYFFSKSLLTSEDDYTCSNIYDVTSLRTPNSKNGTTRLYYREHDCDGSGQDYSVISITPLQNHVIWDHTGYLGLDDISGEILIVADSSVVDYYIK